MRKQLAKARNKDACARFRLLFLCTIAFSIPLTLNAEKPFDFASTPGKLPKNVVAQRIFDSHRAGPDEADLHRLGNGQDRSAHNRSRIGAERLELEITSASVDEKAIAPAAIKLDAKEETLTITLPEELPAGTHTLTLSFHRQNQPTGTGLFYARYQEQGTNAKKIMLGTQFEATDARRLFPCWDEPSFRARFQLTAVVPENFTRGFQHAGGERKQKSPAARKSLFAMSPSMSSYLNVFVAGELDLD